MYYDNTTGLTYQALVKSLDAGEVKGSYFFYGPEGYLIDTALRKFKEVVIEPGTADFNWHLFRAGADEVDWTAFANALSSMALLPSKRVVVLKDLNKALRNKSVVKLIENAIAQIDPDLCLILIEEEPDLKKAFYKNLQKSCTVVAFPPATAPQIEQFLRERAGQFHKTIQPAALEKILSESEPNLRELLQKLDVLVFYVGEEAEITVDAVEKCTAFTREVEIFNLLQALGKREANECRRIVDQLSRKKVETGSLLVLLYRQIWAMYRMKYLQDQRVPQNKWQDFVVIRPQFLERRYRQYLPNFTRAELGRSLELVAEADKMRKSSSVQDDLLLRTLTEKLLQP